MLSPGYKIPLDRKAGFPLRLFTLFCLFYGIAAGAVLISRLPWFVDIPLLLGLLASAVSVFRLHVFRLGPASVVMLQKRDEDWRLYFRDGGYRDASLSAGSFWLLGIVVLVFRPEAGRGVGVLVSADEAGEAALRLMRGYARFCLGG